MKRFYAVIIAITMLFLTSCGSATQEPLSDSSGNYGSVVINMPADDTVNGYRLPNNSQDGTASDGITAQYYANTSTKKFHRQDCGYAKKISDENLYCTDNRSDLISKGYTPCKSCNP